MEEHRVGIDLPEVRDGGWDMSRHATPGYVFRSGIVGLFIFLVIYACRHPPAYYRSGDRLIRMSS